MIFGQAVNTGDVYVINHSNVVYSVNVYGTGETVGFENETQAIEFAKSLISKISSSRFLAPDSSKTDWKVWLNVFIALFCNKIAHVETRAVSKHK